MMVRFVLWLGYWSYYIPSVVFAMFKIDNRIGNFPKAKINNVERSVVSEELYFRGDYNALQAAGIQIRLWVNEIM